MHEEAHKISKSKMISYKRLKERIGKIDSIDYEKIKKSFSELHKLNKI